MSGQLVTVVTHRRPEETEPALEALFSVARSVGAEVSLDAYEVRKHGLTAREGLRLGEAHPRDADLCFALGGDGTILRALRAYAGTGVPVFAVNFGELGFLATVDSDDYRVEFRRAFAHEFEVLALPGLSASVDGERWIAINDVSVQRRQGQRVAKLTYSVGRDVIGNVRCDGLVVATPAGSTGYNLANGGPVMAWGVKGMVVSFIAPHALTARALVVAPDDTLTIENSSSEEAVDVVVDGRPMAVLVPGGRLEIRFANDQGLLAQIQGVNFYQRLHEKFGRLATLR